MLMEGSKGQDRQLDFSMIAYHPDYARATVEMWRASKVKALGIGEIHGFDDHLYFLDEILAEDNSIYLALVDGGTTVAVPLSVWPAASKAPTMVMPDTAFAPDMRGVCSVAGTLEISSKPRNIARTKVNNNRIIMMHQPCCGCFLWFR